MELGGETTKSAGRFLTFRSFLAHFINKEGLVWLCSDPGSVVQSCHKQSEWYQKNPTRPPRSLNILKGEKNPAKKLKAAETKPPFKGEKQKL